MEGGLRVPWMLRREVVHEPACWGPVAPPLEVPGCGHCGVHIGEQSWGPGIGSSQGGSPREQGLCIPPLPRARRPALGFRHLCRRCSGQVLTRKAVITSRDKTAVFSSFRYLPFFSLTLSVIPLPGSSDGKGSTHNAGDAGLIAGLGRSPGGGHGNPLQYSCLENPVDRGAWPATVCGAAESDMTEQLTL